jgi:hypothetical protein
MIQNVEWLRTSNPWAFAKRRKKEGAAVGHLPVRYFRQHSGQRHFMTLTPFGAMARESLQPCRALMRV